MYWGNKCDKVSEQFDAIEDDNYAAHYINDAYDLSIKMLIKNRNELAKTSKPQARS